MLSDKPIKKTCVTCKYHEVRVGPVVDGDTHLCKHPKNKRWDPVTGDVAITLVECTKLREVSYIDVCGIDANWWEKKE